MGHLRSNLMVLVLVLCIGLPVPPMHAANGPADVNSRLENSASPYLQSHSHDRVRWYTWGEDAFARARELDRPLLVSFGYLACHWCHVMQDKHFNDPAIAAHINANYVPVVVDRERRTALDESYMLVTELLTRRGGWPNTVFITPDLKPFYGTAYIEPEEFTQLLSAITAEWADNRAAILSESDRLSSILNGFLTRSEAAVAITPEALVGAVNKLVAQFDTFSGGMGEAPKFFRPTVLAFLLHMHARTPDPAAIEAVERTLQAIRSGGIHDHIEGGFHRYAIDPGWRVPHFEKMLYDQGQLAELYLEAYRLTGNPDYAATARKTLDYILADLTAPGGAFYSTRDADSEGEEGTYYVWSPEQLTAVLGERESDYAVNTFGLIADGDFAGKVILNYDSAPGQTVPRLIQIINKLAKARKNREKPVRDEKILIAWNGLTIAAFAHAGVVLDAPQYVEAARRAGAFIWDNMRNRDDKLLRSYFDGAASIDGEVDDYTQLARAYLFLFDATGDRTWLHRAEALAAILLDEFRDPDAGDFFATRAAVAFGRSKPRNDADLASGNGAAVDMLARLHRRTGKLTLRANIDAAIAALSGLALGTPSGGASVLAAADRFERGEVGPVRYAGNGNVRLDFAQSADRRRFEVSLHVAEGWHVNAHKPLEDAFIPTKLTVADDAKASSVSVSYPEPVTKSLGFNAKPLALYENAAVISLESERPLSRNDLMSLQLQVCSDQICLLPEDLRFRPFHGGQVIAN